jgi:hypothetical protein
MSEMPQSSRGAGEPIPEPANDGGKKGLSSPYSLGGGGGGVTLERRVTARYLALLLTGHGAGELGSGRRALSIAVQQAPAHREDLVISGARDGEAAPTLVVTIGIRRAPPISSKNPDTPKLFADFVKELLATAKDGLEHRLGLAVAGSQSHPGQLQKLAALARDQPDPERSEELVGTEGKINRELEQRLGHVKELVHLALTADGPEPEEWDGETTGWMVDLCAVSILSGIRCGPPSLHSSRTARTTHPPARTHRSAREALQRIGPTRLCRVHTGGAVRRCALARPANREALPAGRIRTDWLIYSRVAPLGAVSAGTGGRHQRLRPA